MSVRIVGIGDQQQAYMATEEDSFRMSEFWIIEDPKNGDLVAEVVETFTYNEMNGLPQEDAYLSTDVLEEMKNWLYDFKDGTIYIAKLSLIEEAMYPIETGSPCRVPEFEEVRDYFLPQDTDHPLTIGVIRNTDEIYKKVEEKKYKNLLKTLEGKSLLEQKELPYQMDLHAQSQYPHIGIFGSSGSGKSYGLRVLLEELISHQIPNVVLDPHNEMTFSVDSGVSKKNYSLDSEIFYLGQDIGVDFKDLSPRDFKILLSARSNLTENMEYVVDALHHYKDTLLSFENRIKGFQEISRLGLDGAQGKLETIEDSSERELLIKQIRVYEKYEKTLAPAAVDAVFRRFNGLKGMGIFQKDTSEVFRSLKNRKTCIIRGEFRMLQIYATFLLDQLYHRRRAYQDFKSRGFTLEQDMPDYFPPFLICTDEAHQFAPNHEEFITPSKGILKEIAQEGRKYGVFLVLATQRPTLLDSTIIAQLNTKMIFRTGRETDIQTIREETDLMSEQARRLPYLRSGDVFISEAGTGRTIYARIRASHTVTPHQGDPFDELEEMSHSSLEENFGIIKDFLPINDRSFIMHIEEIKERYGIQWSTDEFRNVLDELVQADFIEVTGDLFKQYIIKN